VGHRRILLVEDDPLVRKVFRRHLTNHGYSVDEAESVADVRARKDTLHPALVLLDLHLPDGSGIDLLPELIEWWPTSPVIAITGDASVESAVRAMQLGAHSYLQKPVRLAELEVTIAKAIETGRLKFRVSAAQSRNSKRFGFDNIVAKSDGMRRVLDHARILVEGTRPTTILILGESGTGKGLLASALHYASARGPEPFLKVTCSAIPEALLEAELFGHEAGAFTDAKEQRRGVFETADHGTVFLDEIGDMPHPLQAKLLGILEDKSFRRIGSQTSIDVDVRVIAATHRDLTRAVADGSFRSDLFYRLNVVPLTIPPLRDRHEDIVPLAHHFIAELNRSLGRGFESISKEAEQRLLRHGWVGNVRELRNALERAMLFADGGQIEAGDLFLDSGIRLPDSVGGARGTDEFRLPDDGIDVEKHTMDLVRQAMERTGNNQSRAAVLLGLSRDQIRYRLEKMGMTSKRSS
jgi:two-component system response regulator AtoC